MRIMPGLKQIGIGLYDWFEQRLGLGKPIVEMAEHEVPENTSSWWYVFGSAATVLLGLQVMTGILLALVYTPSASHAWNSLQFLDHGGAYYADGARASGPPERGLFEYEYKVIDGRLMISAGKMPTLANEARVEMPLTQIVGAGSGERLSATERPKPRCGSCQG